MDEITPGELKQRLDRGEAIHLLDVREAAELEICSLKGAEHIPMLQLFLGVRRPGAGPGQEIVVVCHHGIRSLEAVQYLRLQGFPKVRSLRGGIDAWAETVDPALPRY